MEGIKINGVSLYIGKIPGRKQNCFYFQEGNVIYPVAYIKDRHMKDAEYYWNKMLDGVPKE